MENEKNTPDVVNGPNMQEMLNSDEVKKLMENLQVLTDLQAQASKKPGSKKPMDKKKKANRKKEKARRAANRKRKK